MATSTIELELRKLGLKEKEVKVYLAGLELGPNSVQHIAEKTGISRPTVYEVIKSLKKKKLFSETKEGKKRYFTAQSPAHILGVLKIQKKEIEEKEREFIRIISSLESRYSLNTGSGVRTYKGKDGLEVLNEILSFTSSPEILIFSSETTPKIEKKRQEIYEKIKKRLGKIEIKEISSNKIMPKHLNIQKKFSTCSEIKGTLILFDKAIFLPHKGQEGFLIENALIIKLLKAFFLSLWKTI